MAAPAGERRVVSVLLADIANSTAIGEQLGPERSKFLFDEVVRLIAAEAKRFGGTVAQLTGDGLYALFGAPAAHEDDAERAARAALALRTALAAYAGEVRDAYGIELTARVGINTGPVVLLPDEAPAEERYNALGDTVNVAARLQASAGTSGVAIGPLTARQIEDVFELEPLGPLELKGKAEPVEAFRLMGEREADKRRVSPLVGREQEVTALDEILAELTEGRGSIVAVTGEPGIGKSRLAAEARDRWSEQVRFLGMQGVSYAREVPYYPLRELLRGFAGLGVADPEARVRLELKARLAALLGDRGDAYYPFLASLLGLALEGEAEERMRALARDSVQRQTHEAVLELAHALARERPLCLVLEDLHFADEPTLALCEELLSLAEEEATAVFLLYRSDPDLPSWDLGEAARRRYRHRFHELQLEPLDANEGARLAASAAGAEITEELAARLAERTGGNPLFLEEAARDAVERGDGATVPTAIQETLQARLERLAPDAREVASIASVVGRTFGTPLLEQIVPPERLRPALSELQRLDLVVEERRRPAPEYRFRHGLVQEAAYASLLDQRRRDLHRIVGTALEELHGHELSEAYGLLARHFAEADEPKKAARYLLEAGDAARAVYADEEAIAHYRRALSFLDRLGDAGRARSVLFKIALAHHLAFDFEAANEAWAEAFTRPEPPPAHSELTEQLTLPGPRVQDWMPGYGYDVPSWLFGPNLFRGLLRIDRLDVVPDLAERIAVSPDGCTYDVLLREKLRWSDGEPLTADDFAFSYRSMLAERVPTAYLLEEVQAESPDDRILRLQLAEPRAYMIYLLAQLPFFPWPRHCVESLGDGWREPVASVGNGPFVLREFGLERIVLTANPHWPLRRGNVGQLTIEKGQEPGVPEEWRSNRYDVLFAGGRSRQLRDERDTITLPIPLPLTEFVAFASRPPFDDERIRKALAHALNRDLLVAGTAQQPAHGGFLPPAMPGHSHDLAPRHDLARARSLLADAGYPDGRGLPELPLVHADYGFGEPHHREVDALWQAQWRELGVRVRQEWVPGPELVSAIPEDLSFWEWGWGSDYPDPHGMLANFVAFQPVGPDDERARLISRARSLRSRDERLQLYRDADRLLVAEHTWVVPTTYDHALLLHRPWVQGLWASPIGISTLDEVVVRH
jgi:ABC-type transport system substrate-binding protein/class 3 adenylate cyclase